MQNSGMISLEQALSAQRALRQSAGLPEEEFPASAFVGMISDEVEALRKRGRSDDEIAAIVQGSSSIRITGEDIARYYAPPEQRHQHGEGTR